ncbi:MAG: carboxypeptidase-like regulatory domain-containing protein [Planctomycetota bacterium]
MRLGPERAALAAAIFVLAGMLALGSWFVFSGPDAGASIQPEPAVEPGQRPEPPSFQEEGAGSKPREIELRLETRALLEAPSRRRGPEDLLVESRRLDRPAPARLRFVEGPDEGRRVDIESEKVVEGLSRGWHLIELTGPDSLETTRLVRLRPEGSERLVVDWSRFAEVSGTVFDFEGRPVPGALVRVGSKELRSDARGAFASGRLIQGGDIPILIAAPGLACYFERVATGSRGLRFVLQKGLSLQGHVQMPAADRAGARIAVLPAAHGFSGALRVPWFWRGRFHQIPLAPGGMFRIDGLPRHVQLALGVLHPQYVQDEPLLVPGTGKGQLTQAFLHPRKEGVLHGLVQDAESRPIAGARLSAENAGGIRWGQSLLRRQHSLALPGWIRGLGGTSAVSDGDGSYTLGLPWKRNRVRVSAPGFLEARATLRSGELRRDFRLLGETEGEDSRARIRVEFWNSNQTGVGRLRIHIRRDGSWQQAPFLWDPTEALEIELPGPALIRFGWHELGEERIQGTQELRVTGLTRTRLDLTRQR